MGNITTVPPDWFKEYNSLPLNDEYNTKVEIKVYSKITKRVIYEVTHLGMNSYDEYYIYDYAENKSTYICGDENNNFPVFSILWDDIRCKREKNFVSFKLYTGDYDSNENAIYYYIYLDGKFNNAPNLTGKDIFDCNFRSFGDIINDYLYFEYQSSRFLIDGDYNIIAKFPKRLDTKKNTHIKQNTTQFILQDGKGYCLYDSEENKIIFKNIKNIYTNHNDFMLQNGDVYIYNKETGKFDLYSKFDKEFLKDSTEILSLNYYGSKYTNLGNVRIFKNKDNKYYIVHDNVVVNKNFPLDEVKKLDEYYVLKYLCRKGDFEDIYNHKGFVYNTIGKDGVEKTKLWFEK